MRKNLKIGLYNPYLDTLGGGEKHILSIIDVISENSNKVMIFWDNNIINELEKRFPLQCLKKINWLPTSLISSSLKAMKTLKGFDYFFYITNGSYFFSTAKNNFVFAMVPDKKLYNSSLLNKLKLFNYRFISNSPYTTSWLTKWGINPITIPPYIDDKLFSIDLSKKEKIILSVGRFFPHLHSKNQEKIIDTFKLLKKTYSNFNDYKLILAGGLKKENQKYFNKLKLKVNKDNSIIFKPNLSFNELYSLYQKSTYFWHFTGLGINEKEHPEMAEHFGIAPLEAIASKCITFCHNSGGPKEIISSGKTGFLFNNETDILNKITAVEENNSLKTKIISTGVKYVQENYCYQIFKKKVLETL